MKSIKEIIDKSLGIVINEITSTSNVGGTYKPPLRPGLRKWFKKDLMPFIEVTSDYRDAELNYDMLDGHTKKTKKEIQKKEKIANHIAHKDYKQDAPAEGDDEYAPVGFHYLKKIEGINESDSSITAGAYNAPLEIGLKKWKKNELFPFINFVNTKNNHKSKKKSLKNNIKRVVGVWEKNKDGSYKIDKHDVHTINEDLAVWFGTKKKPKGSKQPKGPWVNICRKKEGGGHPPCGRPEADSKGYPKCRAAGVASKMTDSQKKSACAQKRRAEKANPKSGTGNKPKMVSYKPRQDEQIIKDLIKKFLK